jgi:hypothetical protein
VIKIDKRKLTENVKIKKGRSKSSSSENVEMTPAHNISNSDVDSDASVGIRKRLQRKAGRSADSHHTGRKDN